MFIFVNISGLLILFSFFFFLFDYKLKSFSSSLFYSFLIPFIPFTEIPLNKIGNIENIINKEIIVNYSILIIIILIYIL